MTAKKEAIPADTGVTTLETRVVPYADIVLGTNIRRVSGFEEDTLRDLAQDIGVNGLFRPLSVYEGTAGELILWDGFRRHAAIALLPRVDERSVTVDVTEHPPHLVSAQLRANNYTELLPGELALALEPMYRAARRPKYARLAAEGKPPYERGTGQEIARATGIQAATVSRLGAVLLWDDLAAVWALLPDLPLTVMVDAGKLTGLDDRAKHFISTGTAPVETLKEVYGETVIRRLVETDVNEGEGGKGKSRANNKSGKPSAKVQTEALKVLDPARGDMEDRLVFYAEMRLDNDTLVRDIIDIAYRCGAADAIRWTAGAGFSPVGGAPIKAGGE
jgi:hypothetical protein